MNIIITVIFCFPIGAARIHSLIPMFRVHVSVRFIGKEGQVVLPYSFLFKNYQRNVKGSSRRFFPAQHVAVLIKVLILDSTSRFSLW